MKKNVYPVLIALATLSVTSCLKDEVVESVPQAEPIEFSTYLGRDVDTRGNILGGKEDFLNFGVFASYTSGSDWSAQSKPNFMFNQKVERTKLDLVTYSGWTYNPLKYWPTTQQNEKISFFAYAPYASDNNCITVKSNNTSAGAPQITYNITAANLATMADFTADVLMNEVKNAAGANPDNTAKNIEFGFQHELTRLAIEAKLDREAFAADKEANKTKINIKKISFSGNGFATSADYTFATTTDARGTWNYTNSGTLDVTAGAEGSVLVNNNADNTWLTSYTQEGYLLENTDSKKLFGEDQYLFLIPPTANGITSDEKAVSMKVEYDIVTADNALENGYSVMPAVKQIDLPTNAGLLTQGAAYRFTLTFNLNEVTFTANVENWPDQEGANDANVDYPKTDVSYNN